MLDRVRGNLLALHVAAILADVVLAWVVYRPGLSGLVVLVTAMVAVVLTQPHLGPEGSVGAGALLVALVTVGLWSGFRLPGARAARVAIGVVIGCCASAVAMWLPAFADPNDSGPFTWALVSFAVWEGTLLLLATQWRRAPETTWRAARVAACVAAHATAVAVPFADMGVWRFGTLAT